MTEESYQQCRKLMQKINYMRGRITTAKGNVAKWTYIESSYREQLMENQAIGAKKILDKAMLRLKEVREKFSAMKFPDSDLTAIVNRCKSCGTKIPAGETSCGDC